MYDIINVLSCINLIKRERKNVYTWQGVDSFERKLEQLKVNTILQIYRALFSLLLLNTFQVSQNQTLTSESKVLDKSLAALSEKFVLLFLKAEEKNPVFSLEARGKSYCRMFGS